MFGNYAKLAGSIVGNLVAVGMVWLAFQFPAIATCTADADGNQLCTALGFTQAQVTAAVMMIVNSYFVYKFPANKP